MVRRCKNSKYAGSLIHNVNLKCILVAGMYNIYVEDFMVRDVKYIWHGITYQRLKETLKENRKLRGFPLVDNPDNMILLGSIQRLELIKLIEKHIGRERRLQVRNLIFFCK